MTPELAELVGYFMGDGSLHAKGLRFCVAKDDADVVEHLRDAIAALFGLEADVAARQGYTEVAVNSVPLTLWWEACGFAKLPPAAEHRGKGWVPTSRTPFSIRMIQRSTRHSSAGCSRPTERRRTATSRGSRRARRSAATFRRCCLRWASSRRARSTFRTPTGERTTGLSCACSTSRRRPAISRTSTSSRPASQHRSGRVTIARHRGRTTFP